VNRAAHLLVDEHRAHRPVDAEVRPDPDLPEHARAVVGGEHRLQHLVAAVCPRRHHAPLTELQLDAGDLDAARR